MSDRKMKLCNHVAELRNGSIELKEESDCPYCGKKLKRKKEKS